MDHPYIETATGGIFWVVNSLNSSVSHQNFVNNALILGIITIQSYTELVTVLLECINVSLLNLVFPKSINF